MKKNYKALALLIAVLLSSATMGCSANIKVDDKKGEENGIEIKIQSDEQQVDHGEINHVDKDVEPTSDHGEIIHVDKDIEPTSDHGEIIHVDKDVEPTSDHGVINHVDKDVEPTNDHGEIIHISGDTLYESVASTNYYVGYNGYNYYTIEYSKINYDQSDTYLRIRRIVDDRTLWEYDTVNVGDYADPVYKFLGGFGNDLYIKENKDVVILNANTGKKVDRIKNVGYNIAYLGHDGINMYFAETNMDGILIDRIVAYDMDTHKKTGYIELADRYKDMEYRIYETGKGMYVVFKNKDQEEEYLLLNIDIKTEFDCTIEKINY